MSRSRRWHAKLLAVGAVLFLLIGCGPDKVQSEDYARIKGKVSSLADSVGSPVHVQRYFTSEAMPANEELARYAALQFEPVGQPKIKGDQATVRVRVRRSSEELGQVEWAFVREGEEWKIKAAPLP